MIKNTKKFIFPSPILSILFLLVFTLIGLGCTPKVSIRRGSNIISKQVFFKPKDKVAFLLFPENINYNTKSDLILLSRAYQNPYKHNLLFVSNNGTLKSSIFLDYYCLYEIISVDIDNDGINEFFSCARNKVFLLDISGQIVWEFSPSELENIWAIHIGFGDLDGDGLVEFVAAYDKEGDYSSSVYILDHQGNLENHFVLPEDRFNFQYMKVFDTNGDAISEIVCNGIYGIHIFNSKGNLLRRFKPVWEGWHLSLWPMSKKEPLVYGPKSKSILLTDLTGRIVKDIRLSKGDLCFLSNPPIPVFLKGTDEKAYFAATHKIPYVYDRSYFYIFDSTGKLIYEEILPERIDDILAVPDDKSKKEYLFVSVCGKVWIYKLLDN